MSGRINLKMRVITLLFLMGMACTSMGGTIFVDANVTGADNGSSWADAYNYLQDALADANSDPNVNEIRVAQGIYKPDANSADPNGSGDRTATFQLINGVALRGGYAGFSEPDPNARDIDLYETILNGDLNDDDVLLFSYSSFWGMEVFEIQNMSENSYHVVTSNGTDNTTLLDGFTIRGGNADSSGGGIYNTSGNLIISNCTFKNNAAPAYGAGMANFSNGHPLLIKCKFINNLSSNWESCSDCGGSAFFSNGSLTDRSWPTLKDCTFTHNLGPAGSGVYATEISLIGCKFINNGVGEGGALYIKGIHDGPFTVISTYPKIINCEFLGNFGISGGAVYVAWDQLYPTFVNCVFSSNMATVYPTPSYNNGGGIYFYEFMTSMYPVIKNCTFINNRSTNQGGGIYAPAGATISNCIFWSNTADSAGSVSSAQIEGSPSAVFYCCIQDDDPDDSSIPFGGTANNNIDDDPNFIREPNDGGDGWNIWGNNDDYGNLRLQYVSPCIDTAGNTSVPADSEDLDDDGNTTEPIPYDLDNHPRIVDGDCNDTDIVDMGAYEFTYAYFGDFDGQCDVDFVDFSILASQWLKPPGIPSADIAPEDLDGIVDELDLAILVEHWLEDYNP